jgi:pseudaminic acid cytidylyltransferase
LNIAIIPARGGSKRIPRKNIRPFCGRPLIAYSIEAARKSGIFDHVLVSTDDAEVREVASAYGAAAPFERPTELANDYATTVPVVKHALEWCEANYGPVTNVCCIYATAPFIQPQAIREAYAELVEKNVQGYVFTATTFPFPIQRAFRIKADGFVEMFEPRNYEARSQDLEPAYQDAGQFYWGNSATYLSEKMFFSSESRALLLPRHLVQDIDTVEDWKRAELMYEVLRRSGEIE